MKQQHLSSLWVGGALSYLERLCLASMLDTGHDVTLYTYLGVSNVPAGVRLANARDIMPRGHMLKDKRLGSYALGSDIFRYRLLQQDPETCWVDCDMLFLQPLAKADYIFGWERPDSINSAILRLPPDSPILSNCLALAFHAPVIMPWWSQAKQLRHRVKAKLGYGRTVASLPWGAIGPRAITYYTHEAHVVPLVKPYHVFYPNPSSLAADVFDPAADIDSRLRPDTIAIHLWNTELRDVKMLPIPQGCFIDRWYRRLTPMLAAAE